MLKKWFARTSPFLVLSLVTAFLLVYQTVFEHGGADEWRHPLILRLLLFLILLVGIDLILKYVIKKNAWLWGIELLLCLGLFYYWIIT